MRVRDEGLVDPLDHVEPLPPSRLPVFRSLPQHTGVVAEPGAVGADEQDSGAECAVAVVESVLDALLERGFVQEGKVVVHLPEIVLDQGVHEVPRREVLERGDCVLQRGPQPLDRHSLQSVDGSGQATYRGCSELFPDEPLYVDRWPLGRCRWRRVSFGFDLALQVLSSADEN